MNAKEIRPLTRLRYECLRLDEWPSPATCLDFGIETEKHLGALQWAVSAEGVSFRTPWDSLFATNGDTEAE